MKNIRYWSALLLTLLFTIQVNATILRSDAGPYARKSTIYSWVTVWGYNFNATLIGTNTVDFKVAIEQIGNPPGSSFYDFMITVRNSSGVLVYTGYPTGSGTATVVSRSTAVIVPTSGSYNITIWARCSQPSSLTDYWRAVFTDIVVSN